jgi:hypothetical protein
MKSGTIKFKGEDEWSVVNLYRFLHYLNVFYNRLYVLEKYSHLDYSELKKKMNNSLSYIGKGNELSVSSMKLHSPFEIKLFGISDILKTIIDFYKDITYRIALEKKERELELEKKQIAVEKEQADLQLKQLELFEKEKELQSVEKQIANEVSKIDLEIKQLELFEKKFSLLKKNGYTDKQCNEIIKTLINPSNKMFKSGEKNNVHIVDYYQRITNDSKT